MNDQKCLELLRLLNQYFEEYTEYEPSMTVSELVDDIAMSMDITSDEADHYRQQMGN